MIEAVKKVVNESLTYLAQQYYKARVEFYAPVVLRGITTTQRLALGAVPEGTMVYDSTLKMPMIYSGTGWQYMSTGCEASNA